MQKIVVLMGLLLANMALAAPSVQTKVAGDGISMRKIRKVGVGLNSMGAYGLAGVNLELNFTSKVSAVAGFGMGDGYQTFNFQIRQMIGGTSFLPYVAAGYTRWYTTGNEVRQMRETAPEFLAKDFLNSSERATGQFAENLIYPAAGVQFMVLDGEWAGFAVNAEFLFLIDIDDLVSAPVGQLGMTYYF